MAVATVKSVVCLTLLLNVSVYCMAMSPQYILWQQNSYRSKEFNCSEPQPRSIKASDLFSDQSVTVEPPYTVLHRCDSFTGCCLEKTQECRMLTEVTVDLVFYNIDIREYVTVQGKNHTACSCQTASSSIK